MFLFKTQWIIEHSTDVSLKKSVFHLNISTWNQKTITKIILDYRMLLFVKYIQNYGE